MLLQLLGFVEMDAALRASGGLREMLSGCSDDTVRAKLRGRHSAGLPAPAIPSTKRPLGGGTWYIVMMNSMARRYRPGR